MIRKFILRTGVHVASMKAAIDANWQGFAADERPLQVVVSVYRRTRSNEQNALMWVWLGQLERDAWVAGRQYSAETWHEHAKRELLPDLCSKGIDKWRNLPTGEQVLLMGTSDLNVAEMGDYMTALQAWAATTLGMELQ